MVGAEIRRRLLEAGQLASRLAVIAIDRLHQQGLTCSAHALRLDRPRACANLTCCWRACALTIFCVDFPRHLDGPVALGEQLFQPRVLMLQRTKLLHVGRFQFVVPLAP